MGQYRMRGAAGRGVYSSALGHGSEAPRGPSSRGEFSLMAGSVPDVSVPKNLTTHPLQTERDFFGRVVIRRAAALSAGVRGCGICGGRGWGRAEDQPCPPTEDTAPEADAVEQRMGTAVGRSDVWFRFKEGVSNAVRRNLHIRDLL